MVHRVSRSQKGLIMNIFAKCVVTFAALLYLGIPSMGFGSDLPAAHPPVVCVIASFTVPGKEMPWHYTSKDRLLKTINNVPQAELAQLSACYAKRRLYANTFYLPLPYIASLGPTARSIDVELCLSSGEYRYKAVLAPANSFVHVFHANEKRSRGTASCAK